MQEPPGGTVTVRAHSNIALVKYWGKRDATLNIPAVGSLSVTLDALSTDTSVAFDDSLPTDLIELNGTQREDSRVLGILDLVRQMAGIDFRAQVTTKNNFPTGAGLASSASGFAALASAASQAAGLSLKPRELSILARRGSGSAARSIFGGIVEMHTGVRDDGSDSFAEQLRSPSQWPLAVVIAITDSREKAVGSTVGMRATAMSSPFFDAWVSTSGEDLDRAREAVATGDFAILGEITEYSCLKLHSLMMSTRPALMYWNAATIECMKAVRELREGGIQAYFTIDAGPQVKVLCMPNDVEAVASALQPITGIEELRFSALGPGAQRLR